METWLGTLHGPVRSTAGLFVVVCSVLLDVVLCPARKIRAAENDFPQLLLFVALTW